MPTPTINRRLVPLGYPHVNQNATDVATRWSEEDMSRLIVQAECKIPALNRLVDAPSR